MQELRTHCQVLVEEAISELNHFFSSVEALIKGTPVIDFTVLSQAVLECFNNHVYFASLQPIIYGVVAVGDAEFAQESHSLLLRILTRSRNPG